MYMNRNKLKWLIQMKEGKHEQRKFRRTIFAVLIYSAFWLCILYAQGQLDTTSLLHFAGEIAACIFLGGITFFVNALIFSQLYSISASETNEIERLKKQLKEMESAADSAERK